MTLADLGALIFGPWGAGIGLLALVMFVGRQWLKERADRIAEKDTRIAKLEGLLDVATDGWTVQTAANAKGAEAQEQTAKAVEAIALSLKSRTTRR